MAPRRTKTRPDDPNTPNAYSIHPDPGDPFDSTLITSKGRNNGKIHFYKTDGEGESILREAKVPAWAAAVLELKHETHDKSRGQLLNRGQSHEGYLSGQVAHTRAIIVEWLEIFSEADGIWSERVGELLEPCAVRASRGWGCHEFDAWMFLEHVKAAGGVPYSRGMIGESPHPDYSITDALTQTERNHSGRRVGERRGSLT